jgi:diguanylate cyclase (GGDEF)-like protein
MRSGPVPSHPRGAHARPESQGATFLAVAGLVLAVVLLVVATSASGLLGEDGTRVLDAVSRLAAGVFATAAALLTWQHAPAGDRRWRLLLAAAAAGWSCGVLLWSVLRFTTGEDPVPPSVADLGFYALPAFLLPALWFFPSRAMPDARAALHGDGPAPRRRAVRAAVFVLDSLVVVGSMFLLAWSTAIGLVLDGDGDSLVGLGYPVTDLLLIVLVVLLGTFRSPANPRALLLLGLGIFAISVSHTLCLYRLATDGSPTSTLPDSGFLVGPALLGLAVLVPLPVAGGRRADTDDLATERRAVLLPYVPLTATGLVLVVQLMVGARIDDVEGVLGLVLVALVVVRQLATLLDNVNLLHQVRDGQDRLRRQAFNDSLTGLANRAQFHDRLRQAIDAHRRTGGAFALLFCDLDDFKHVNDRHGHAAGDELLQAVADRLRNCVRGDDTVARLGGDEFALLLESDTEKPEAVGRRVVAAMEKPFAVGRSSRSRRGAGVPVRVGASVGLVVVDAYEDGVTPDVLLARVDTAMYAAKRSGKSGLVSYGGQRPDSRDATAYLGDLRAALTVGPDAAPEAAREMRQVAGAVEVMYQPIVHVGTGGVVALEALVRWRHPRVGVVPADLLVRLATDAGLLGSLEEHVLDVACRDVHTLRRTPGLGGLAVHVNVSATRTNDARLYTGVLDAIDRFGVPGSALVLEVTETSEVPDLAGAADVLDQIRSLGVRLALDDFGTGYSGLSYLQDLPIDIVKLDRSLTTADVGTRGAAIRTAVVGLARDLGIDLVAEGVESHAQANHLAGLGCDYAQGYLYSRPRFLADLRFTSAASPVARPTLQREPAAP